jgi:hypothetical protein
MSVCCFHNAEIKWHIIFINRILLPYYLTTRVEYRVFNCGANINMHNIVSIHLHVCKSLDDYRRLSAADTVVKQGCPECNVLMGYGFESDRICD